MATILSEEPAPKIRIFIIDEHPTVREGLSLIVNRQPNLMICGVAADLSAALQGIAATHPDFLIIDISLNGPAGAKLLNDIRVRFPTLPVLIVSMHDGSVYAEAAVGAGDKERTETVLGAVREILAHKISVGKRAAEGTPHAFMTGNSEKSSAIAALSDRELQVFRLIGEGYSTRKIAEELQVSVKTVESYQAHIKSKLSLKDGRELVQRAIQWSLEEGAA
jgi:DNA-binding NarL/FixJ family response regulator